MTVKRVCPYLVGNFYITSAGHDPATIWPGTSWERLRGRVLIGEDDSIAAGSTGGSATHAHTTGNCTLTSDQIPSHAHSVGAHAHGLNSHTHGLNSHTHTYAKPNSPTGGTAISVAQLASHTHTIKGDGWGIGNATGDNAATLLRTGTGSSKATESTGSGSAHTHTIGTTSTNTGAASGSTAAASGSTANSAAFNSGSAGGGKAHSHGDTGSASNLPPYLAVYMWKRVA